MRPDPFNGSYLWDNPQSLNHYSFAQNDPANFSDPLGLIRVPVCSFTVVGRFTLRHPQTEQPVRGELMQLACLVFQIDRPERPECQNVDGFTQSIGPYSPEDLNNAAITVFGEISSRAHPNLRAEAEAVASVIFNRSEAIANGTAPPNNLWGNSSSLTDVVSAGGGSQFNGFSAGQELLRTGVDLKEGDRNCTRLQTSGSAIAWLASNAAARQPFYYFCSNRGGGRTLAPNEQRIGGNDFSEVPMTDCRIPR